MIVLFWFLNRQIIQTSHKIIKMLVTLVYEVITVMNFVSF